MLSRHNQVEPNPWLVLLSVALGLFMVIIDVSILNIALPTLVEDLRASLAEVEWTLIVYALLLTGLVPFFGRISDVLGRRRLFITGVLIFGGASLLAALAQSIIWLISARLIQAFGGAMITSNALAIITDTFPEGKRGTAMGIQAIAISGGAAIGPTLGGFLVTHFGWPAIFYVNVPISLIAATLAFRILPPLQTHRTLEPIDWSGTGLLLSGLGLLLLGITKASDWGWGSLRIEVLLAVGAILIVLFVWRELKTIHPLVDISLFRIREFAAGQAAGIFATMAIAVIGLLMPFYWQGLRGYSPQEAGLLVLPLPLTLMIAAPISGRLSDRLGSRGLTTFGLTITAMALFFISNITATMTIWQVLWRFAVLGLGLGTFAAPNNNSVMSAVPPQRRGIASGLLGMFRYSGQSLGIAFGGTVFAHFATAGGLKLEGLPSVGSLDAIGSDPVALEAFYDAFINGLSAAALATIPLVGIGIVLSFMRGSWKEAPAMQATRAED